MSQQEIFIVDDDIQYTVRRSRRAKYMRIEVGVRGDISVVMPAFVSYKQIHAFVYEKRSWIRSTTQKYAEQKTLSLTGTRDEYLKYKKVAQSIISQKVSYWNRYYNFDYNRISIKNMKTQWGSCSSKGNLNFNYKCIFLNEKQLDYIVVHELCHLRQMNHSSRFWDLVAQTIPDCKQLAREVRSIQL